MSMPRLRFSCARRVPLAATAILIVLAGLGSMGHGPAGAAPSAGRPGAGAGAAGTVTTYSDATIKKPEGIAAGPDGSLWFVNFDYSSVERISTSGAITNYTDANAGGPWGIAAGSDGALWFTNVVNNVIARITTKGVESYFAPPTITGPFGITPGPDGALWFTNGGSNTIGRITTDGVVTDFGPGSGQNQQIDEPLGITAGPDGALWFTNYGDDTIGRITTSGVVTDFSGPGISSPGDITVGPDGALWFVNLGDDSIGRITTAGNVKNYTAPTMSGLNGIAAGPDGALWFTNGTSNSIGRITTGGVVTNYTGGQGSGISDPDAIVAGPDGDMWFTDQGNNSIGRITTGPSLQSQTITFTSTPPSRRGRRGPRLQRLGYGWGIGESGPVDDRFVGVDGLFDLRWCRVLHRRRHLHHRRQPGRQQHLQPRPPSSNRSSASDHRHRSSPAPTMRHRHGRLTLLLSRSPPRGTPVPSMSKRGKLPKSVQFSVEDNGNCHDRRYAPEAGNLPNQDHGHIGVGQGELGGDTGVHADGRVSLTDPPRTSPVRRRSVADLASTSRALTRANAGTDPGGADQRGESTPTDGRRRGYAGPVVRSAGNRGGRRMVRLERCESGRIGLTANELTWETGSEGSNPSLSAHFSASPGAVGGRRSGPR